MKNVLYLVASLSALASAANVQARDERMTKKSCSPISYGTCTPGIEKYGAFHWTNHCGPQEVDLEKSGYEVIKTLKDVSFDACVQKCSTVTVCCAVSYKECGGVCELTARTDGTDYCYKSPIYLEKAPGYQASVIIRPGLVPGSIYGTP